MTRWVGFVRNVMVGRQGLSRDVLLSAFRDAGARDVTSHLATGNVSFSTTGLIDTLQHDVEETIAEVIGRHEPVFLRTIEDLRQQIASDPFSGSPIDDPHERCVSFTSGSADEVPLPLWTPRGDAVAFHVAGPDVYSVTRLVGGRPGTIGATLERTLARLVSTRNWNTVERIVSRS